MPARKAAIVLALAVLLAACGSAPRHHAAASATPPTPVTISAPPSPSPSPSPTCDISSWVTGNEPADEIDALRTDLQNVRQGLLNS
jgi:ABC-type glycerol-3-phosphate transport system substrate-binding protein